MLAVSLAGRSHSGLEQPAKENITFVSLGPQRLQNHNIVSERQVSTYRFHPFLQLFLELLLLLPQALQRLLQLVSLLADGRQSALQPFRLLAVDLSVSSFLGEQTVSLCSQAAELLSQSLYLRIIENKPRCNLCHRKKCV